MIAGYILLHLGISVWQATLLLGLFLLFLGSHYLLRQSWLRSAAIVWTIFMAIGCFWPSRGLPDPTTYNDKYIHVLIFVFFGAAWRMAGGSWRQVLLAGVAYGGLIELVQAAVPTINRAGEWLDFAADAAGVVIGLAIAWPFIHRLSNKLR